MIPPDLLKKIRRLEIRTRGLVDETFGGEYHSAFKGQGIEFAEVRPYQIGDDIRAIDWNVSARSDDTFVKVFEEEREQTLLLLVDVSGSEDFGSRGQFKREMAAEICALLAFSATRNADKVGLLLFSDQTEKYVPPAKGRRHVLRMIRDLYALEPKSRGTDIASALRHALHAQRRRSIVVLISDFLEAPTLGTEYSFERPLRALAGRHDVVAIHLQDSREQTLPDLGLVDLIDAETGQAFALDTGSRNVREVFAGAARQQAAALGALFRRTRVDSITVETGEDYFDPLVRYFRRRTASR